MATLASLLTRIPAVTRMRYGGSNFAIWVDWANAILEEIEEIGIGPEMRKMVVYPRRSLNGTAYIPSGLTYISNIKDKDGSEIRFSVVGGNGFQVDASEGDESTALTSFSTSSTLAPPIQRDFGRVLMAIYEVDAGEDPSPYIGKAVVLYGSDTQNVPSEHPDKILDGWIIEDARVINIGGVFYLCVNKNPDLILPTEYLYHLRTYDSFVHVYGYKKIQKLKDVNSEILIPEKFNKALLAGLRYFAEMQTDDTSPNTRYWRSEWERMKRMATSAGAKLRGTIYNAKPSMNINLG
jgi:hypothetical protein